jgi:hypothetical protein
MTPRELLAECHRRGIALEPSGETLHYRSPKGALSEDLKAALVERKSEILALLRPAGDGQPPPLDRPPETEMELRRLIDHLANPVLFSEWLERLMDTTDPAENGP